LPSGASTPTAPGSSQNFHMGKNNPDADVIFHRFFAKILAIVIIKITRDVYANRRAGGFPRSHFT
jgi:hypothetical protein